MTTRNLYFLIHGTKPPRRSPRRARRGPARNWRYRQWIRSLPSAVSGAPGCEAAHTRAGSGLGQKASDFSCIPLTRTEHLCYHAIGRAAFERLYGIDCKEVVKTLNYTWFAYSARVK